MKNKGITLIALIVTVILITILAGVSINLITNGGIIDKTRTSSKEYQYQADKEEFELAKSGATDFMTKIISEEKMEEELECWTHEGEIWTSPNGNKFEIEIEAPSFTFNDFKDCYTMGKRGSFLVPISKFLEVCGLEDLTSNKYYIGARRRNIIFD